MSHLLSNAGLRGQVVNLEVQVTELTDAQGELYVIYIEIFMGPKFCSSCRQLAIHEIKFSNF